MEQEYTAKIENWYVREEFVHGEIHGDTKGRFYDGCEIRTSYLPDGTAGIKEGDIITTCNSKYLLGKPAVATLIEEMCDV